MKLYFSGLAGLQEVEMLREAGIDRVLVDPADLQRADGFRYVALDSGAYDKIGSPVPGISRAISYPGD